MAIGATDVNRVTGHVAVAQPSWKGIPRCSARPASLMQLCASGQLPTVCCLFGPRATPWACRRTGGPPEAFGDQHQIRRRGPQPGAARTGCSLVTREGEQGRGGMLSATPWGCAVRQRAAVPLRSSVNARRGQRRTIVTRRAYPHRPADHRLWPGGRPGKPARAATKGALAGMG